MYSDITSAKKATIAMFPLNSDTAMQSNWPEKAQGGPMTTCREDVIVVHEIEVMHPCSEAYAMKPEGKR